MLRLFDQHLSSARHIFFLLAWHTLTMCLQENAFHAYEHAVEFAGTCTHTNVEKSVSLVQSKILVSAKQFPSSSFVRSG